MPKFKKRARGGGGYFRKTARRVRHNPLGGVLGKAIAGGVVGTAISYGAPALNNAVQGKKVGPFSVPSLVVAGIGAGDKMFTKKGGAFTDAALMFGTAMLVSDVLASVVHGSSSGGGVHYQ